MSYKNTFTSGIYHKAVALFIILCIGTCLFEGCGVTNNSPIVNDLIFQSGPVVSSGSYDVKCIADDTDDDTLLYEWSATGGTVSGEGNTVVWKAPVSAGTYSIEVTVSDGKGGQTALRKSISVVDNRLPVIDRLISEPSTIGQGLQGRLRCYATDPEGGPLVYEWEASDGTFSGKGAEVFWTAPDKPGVYSVTLTAIDSNGGKSTTTITIDVLRNNPPEIKSLKADPLYIVAGKTSSIECSADDPDEDALSYTWEASTGEIHGEGPTVEWTAPANCATSTCTINVTVSDGRGSNVSKDVKIWVRSSGG